MANGLSKLIKRARKANETNILARLAQKRFRVEELEDRIAPAATAVSSGELVIWDADSSDAADYIVAGDGAFYMVETDTNALVANITMGDTSTSLDATAGETSNSAIYVDFDAATIADDNAEITIVCNGYLGDIDLSNLTVSNGKTVTINIVSGSQMVFGDATPDTVNYTIGTAAAGAAGITAVTEIGTAILGVNGVNTVVDGPVTLTELADTASIGTITLPTVAASQTGYIVLNVSAGNDDGAVASANGNITAIADSSAGVLVISDTSDIYCDNISTITVDQIASTLDITGFAGDLTGALSVGTGTIGNLNIGSMGSSSSITAASIGALVVTNDLAGDITVTGAITSLTLTDGSITSDSAITAGSITGAVTVDVSESGTNEAIDGSITTTSGSIGSIVVGATTAGDISGTISSAGAIGNITVGNDIESTASISATTTIGTITVDEAIDGTIQAAGDITAVISTDGSLTGTVKTTGTASIGTVTIDSDDSGSGKLSGTLTSAGTIGVITVGDDLSGTITAAGAITSITTTNGSLSGTVTTTNSGTIGAITVDSGDSANGKISGTITSASTIGAIRSGDDITGNITAGGTITSVTTDNGSISSTIKTTTGNIGAITIDSDGAGSLATGGAIISAGEIAGVTVGGDIIGTITSAGDATGDITADDISGTITIGGNLLNSVTATSTSDGSIDNLIVSGDVDADTSTLTISAAGGNVVLEANGITTGSTADDDVIISASGNVTITAGSITYATVDGSDNDISIIADSDSTDGGDVSLTVTGDVKMSANAVGTDDGEIIITGENVTLALATAATENVPGTVELNGVGTTGGSEVTADDALTISAITGSLNATTIESVNGSIAAIETTGDLTIVNLQATDTDADDVASIGTITAGGDLVLGNVDADQNIGAITSTGALTISTGIDTANGNIGAITVGDADTTSGITMTGSITSAGTVGAISATGDITGAGTISAAQQIAVSGIILSVTDNGIIYTVESDNAVATDVFDLTFDFDAVNDVDIDSITRSTATALNLSVKSNDADGANDTEFDLVDIDFASATITAGYNKLGVLTVDGDIQEVVTLGTGSSADAVILQGNLANNFRVDSLNVIAASQVGGVAATVSLLDAKTLKTAGTADPTATAANGTYVIPADPTDDVVVFAVDADGTALSTTDALTISVGNADDNEATVVFTAGVFTSLTGAEGGITLSAVGASGANLSTLAGDITIDGAVAGTLTLGESLTSLTITGAVTGTIDAANTVISGNVVLGFDAGSGDYSAVTQNITLGNVTGTVTLGDIDGTVTVTIGNIGGNVAISSVGDDSVLAFGEIANTKTITVVDDMTGAIRASVADTEAIAKITVGGNFGSEITISGTGDVTEIELYDDAADGVIGSATSTISVGGSLGKIDLNVASDGDDNTSVQLLANITTGGDAPSIVNEATGGTDEAISWVGSFSFGVNTGADSFGVDNDDTGGLVGAEYGAELTAGGSNNAYFGAAAYDATNGQTYSFTNIVLDEGAAPTLAINGNVSGNVYAGDDLAGTYTFDDVTTTTANDGAITGSVIVDDDANVSALGLTANGDLADTFDNGLLKANTVNTLSLTAGSIGGITVEGDMDVNLIKSTAGDIGDIVIGGDAIDNIDGAADLVSAGNLGLITADGDIELDIEVDETYTFTGIINTGGYYNASFNVEGTVNVLLIAGAFADSAGFDTDEVVDLYDANTGNFATYYAGVSYSTTDALSVSGGTKTLVTVDGSASVTVYNSVAGSVVTIDETEAEVIDQDDNTANTTGNLTVEGDLAGTINLISLSTADVNDIDTLTVQGDWTGALNISNSNIYNSAGTMIDSIVVYGDVTAAVLSAGTSYNTAVNYEGVTIAEVTVTVAGGNVVEIGAGTDNYLYLSNPRVTAEVGYLFGQVSSCDITGYGATQVVSINYASIPTTRDMLLASAYGRLSVIGRVIDNDYIDFDNPADASLSTITVGPSVTLTALVVDGSIGDFTDSNSNIVNLFVSGDAGTIVAGRSIVNAFIGGNATEVSAMNTVARLHVEGSIGTVSGISLANIDVEGDCDNIAASVINNMFVVGDVDSISLSGFGRYAGVIRNSYLLDKDASYTDNFDFVGENGGDDFYNPAAIINSLVSSDEA